MAPIAKEPDVQNSSTPASPVSALQPKVQPVALEVSVTVNGARTVDGSDKREPFSETTQTVLVFGNGAVIRLNSSVAPGQLLFLTNEKTKKEVVCQVVKSKNYRSVSGYVELEFTEPAVGFWGMRFPSDRLAPAAAQSSPAPVAPAKPAPVSTSSAANVVPQNAVPQEAETKPSENTLPVAPVISISAPEPAPVQVAPLSLAGPSVQKIEASAPAAPVDNATEDLRKETARLQEQLSAMLFAETPAPKPATPVPAVDAAALSETASKILELAKPEPVVPQSIPAPATKQFEPLNLAPVASKTKTASSAQDEEVKIPSWLEPLARNAAATPQPPPPVVEIPVSAEAQVAGESYDFENHSELASGVSNESATPSFGTTLLETGDNVSSESGTRGSNKGLLIGAIAAAVLIVAGGGWWYTQQSGHAAVKAAPTTALSQPAPQQAEEQQPRYVSSTSAPGKTYSNANPVSAQSSPLGKPTASPAAEIQKIPATHDNIKNASASETSQPSEPVEQSRKAAFNQIHLAAPTVKGGSAANPSNVGEPGIAMEGSSSPSSVPLTGGLVGSHGSVPTAPVPIGGEVKSVQLLSSVPPVYPQIARSQRISGDVTIDAQIDDHGRVTGMKVLSGPVMLHQAAMDALHQWKYRPATLNGEPVPMHLTVTIQFRLQ